MDDKRIILVPREPLTHNLIEFYYGDFKLLTLYAIDSVTAFTTKPLPEGYYATLSKIAEGTFTQDITVQGRFPRLLLEDLRGFLALQCYPQAIRNLDDLIRGVIRN